MLNLKLKQLLTVIGAHDTYLATDHLSVTARTKVIDQLIEKLTPLGDDNHAYACWILSIIHPHKQVWLEKAAAPATFHEYLKMAALHEAGHHLSADQMIRELAADHETMAKSIETLFHVAEDDNDQVTLDLLIQRKNEHDKTAWMLRTSHARG